MRVLQWSLFVILAVTILEVPIAVPSVIVAQTKSPSILRDEARITKEFEERTKSYTDLQKKLEHMLPALKSSRDQSEILEHQLALRKLVVDARHEARRGEIFNSEISKYFRAVIGEVLRSPEAPIVQRTITNRDPAKPIEVRVNGLFPDELPMPTTPPILLMRLPVLPMELSYRFVGRDFVLQDNKTNLIVDFIPDILP
jgi:hypothetical protein